MLTADQRRLFELPLIGHLATIEADGSPHLVPVWFALDGEDIVVTSFRATRKIGNLERDPRCAMSVGGDPYRAEGYLVRGRASVEADPGHALTAAIVRRYETPEQAEADISAWRDSDVVIVRISIERVTRV